MTQNSKNEVDDGGPAFPVLFKVAEVAKSEGGMSLRDYFAGQVIVGLISAQYCTNEGSAKCSTAEALANLSYGIADDMITERNKR